MLLEAKQEYHIFSHTYNVRCVIRKEKTIKKETNVSWIHTCVRVWYISPPTLNPDINAYICEGKRSNLSKYEYIKLIKTPKKIKSN